MHIQIDWLTISTKTKGEEIEYNFEFYQVKRLEFSTRQFSVVEEVFQNNKRIATICRKPQSSIIAPDIVMVKFDNYKLYDSGGVDLLERFCRDHNLIFKAISRLDIAHDFQTFHNATPPVHFIKSFLKQSIRKTNKGKFTLTGEHHNELDYQYIRFGSGNSSVVTYLYNKSNEMRQVTKKPWIEQQWIDLKMIPEIDVWRLEFRVQDTKLNFIDEATGETITLADKKILLPQNLFQLYQSLVHYYFRFRKVSKDKNFNRWPVIPYFKFDNKTLLKLRICEHNESNRADRIMIKKLHSFYSEMRGVDPVLSQSIEQTQSSLCYDRDLIKWTKQKQLNINPNLSKEPIEND